MTGSTATRAFAALIAIGLVVAPFAAEAKRYRSVRHHGSYTAMTTRGSAGLSATPSRTYYGSSGQTVGTVTAPSVGTYNWPSVGVTNAVPTWSNTNPK
jgi:hypothetical protein